AVTLALVAFAFRRAQAGQGNWLSAFMLFAYAATFSFAYISLIATVIGYFCWFTGFRHLKASTVAMIGLLNPVTGVLLGVFLASELLTITQALGITLVLASIVMSQRGKV
ncbi:MAG: EamA family transporter, partial [Pseudomonadota bacterium]